MTYVDREKNSYGRMKMCHLFADSLEELHDMALNKLHLHRSWFQEEKTPHYDICQAKRKIAVAKGAIEIDRHKAVEIIHEWRERKINKSGEE